MREVLFRGKGLKTGTWIEGFYVYHINRTPSPIGDRLRLDDEEHLIVKDAFSDWNMPRGIDCYHVDPKTVGQYTGLKDKNGKRIFEGDIVEGHCHSAWSHTLQRCVVAYGRDGFEARHHIGDIDSQYYTYRVLFSKDVEVIGNIHDNPELLGGTEIV